MVFAGRKDAGQQLARTLKEKAYPRPLVLALPRGGIPVGIEIARELECPLDTIVARKIGAPLNPEWAVGAIAPGGITVLDEDAMAFAHVSRVSVEGMISSEQKELMRSERAFRSGTYSMGYIPKTVILVDDGIATGMTASAALLYARKKYPQARLVFAAPVCIGGAGKELQKFADETVCEETSGVNSISASYADFTQLDDATALHMLVGELPIG